MEVKRTVLAAFDVRVIGNRLYGAKLTNLGSPYEFDTNDEDMDKELKLISESISGSMENMRGSDDSEYEYFVCEFDKDSDKFLRCVHSLYYNGQNLRIDTASMEAMTICKLVFEQNVYSTSVLWGNLIEWANQLGIEEKVLNKFFEVANEIQMSMSTQGKNESGNVNPGGGE